MSENRTPDDIKEDNEHRLERARAWVYMAESFKFQKDDHQRKESCTNAHQAICYWIAFEALSVKQEQGGDANGFLDEIIKGDDKNLETLSAMLRASKNSLRAKDLVDLRATEAYFWGPDNKLASEICNEVFQNHNPYGNMGREVFHAAFQSLMERKCEAARKKLDNALQKPPTEEHFIRGMKEIFSRMRTTRNQLIHGGSSVYSSWGKTQVKATALLLKEFVPCFIIIVAENPEKDWGRLPYPRTGEKANWAITPPKSHTKLDKWQSKGM